jgi:asparagine synthase (glutamine-hydrolysing)
MCGIGAVIARAPETLADYDLAGMAEALRTRGPDGGGQWVSGGVALVHRRLSIIDLAGGAQPMSSHKGTTITFNGEIYNYRELFAEIGGYAFQTRSDTEAILALYETMGVAGLRRLRGMFAFVLHDPAEGKTFAARDPLGIKPLVWRRTNDALLIASESKALDRLAGDTRRPDPDSLGELLDQHYLAGVNTAVQNTYKLTPGEIVELTPEGPVFLERVRPVSCPDRAGSSDPADLPSVLRESVEMHVRADVPVALFLSGGTDSVCLLHLMHLAGLQRPNTYTVSFSEGPGADDQRIAKTLASHYGCKHQTIPFAEADFWRILPQLAAYIDDPTTDYALLPTWRLAETAAHDVKVVLSGEGGDEMFAGYGRYRRRTKQALRTLRNRIRPKRESAPVLKSHKRTATARNGGGMVADLNKLTWLQRRQAIDIAGWLPDDLLKKLDICLMAHGLEGRVPFTDRVVADYGLRLPDSAKVKSNVGKHALKAWLAQEVPAAEPFRRKQGFTVPVAHWLAPYGRQLGDLLARQRMVREYLDPDGVRTVMRTPHANRHLAWSLLILAVWWRGESTSGITNREELFDALAQWAKE